jgi:CBS domain-containing protein
VRERVTAAGQEMCIVVNDRGVVLGRLRRKELAGDADAVVEDVMELGPPTERADPFLSEVIERLRKTGTLLVTWYGSKEDGGRLVGVLFREDVERALEENERLPK